MLGVINLSQLSKIPFANSVVTLIHKYYVDENGKRKVRYLRKVLENCYWASDRDKLLTNNISIDSNSIICKIPADTDFVDKYLGAEGTFSISVGDIVFLGNVNATISSVKQEQEIIESHRVSGVMIVKKFVNNEINVKDDQFMIPHYKLVGE